MIFGNVSWLRDVLITLISLGFQLCILRINLQYYCSYCSIKGDMQIEAMGAYILLYKKASFVGICRFCLRCISK